MNISSKLREIKIENYIWIIYVGIIYFSWYANSLEKDYFLNKNINSKKRYREIMISIFSILVIIYSYFLIDSIEGLKSLNKNSSLETIKLSILSFIASLLIFISGLIFLYIAYNDSNIDVEIAFN